MMHGNPTYSRFALGIVLALLSTVVLAANPQKRNPASSDPQKTDADFPFQGEYVGDISHDGQAIRFGVQVVAMGDGNFTAVAYPGGLPGDGWTPPNTITGEGSREGEGKNGRVKLTGVDWGGVTRQGEIRNGAIIVVSNSGTEIAKLLRVNRKSPTLGQAPPKNAVVIFDGMATTSPPDTSKLIDGRVADDGLLMEGVTSKDSFGDSLWHIEFRLPYQPKDRGQGRGNSGAYLQGAYEVQMLDSFGLKGENNECGGVYSVAKPSVNMCLPPLEWQTYDIDFTAPRFESDRKVSDPRITVRHNGVVIQDNVEIPKITPGGTQSNEKHIGPLHLQNHGNPVRYRNIWVLPKP